VEDHSHEYLRHWEVDALPNTELLEACASIMDVLHELSVEAHAQADAETRVVRRDHQLVEPTGHAYPCMDSTLKHRAVRTRLKNGVEVWKNEPAGLHFANRTG
jgi:hypothetical protein